MFDSNKNISTRLANAADLMIDFATLGEYGLEPVHGRTPRPCEATPRPRAPQQESFSEALFPNRHTCSPGRNAARRRDGRGASRAFPVAGAS
jgi:hypothetical protein